MTAWSVVALAVLAAQKADREAWVRGDPVPVVLGQAYVVHYLRPGAFGLAGLGEGGEAVLHSALPSGKMRTLVRAGGRGNAFNSAPSVALGVAADADRVYVATRADQNHYTSGLGEFAGTTHRYYVQAFWLADGSEVADIEVPAAEVPKKLPDRAVLKGGPITLTKTGAECFGRAFAFDGKKLVGKPAAKK